MPIGHLRVVKVRESYCVNVFIVNNIKYYQILKLKKEVAWLGNLVCFIYLPKMKASKDIAKASLGSLYMLPV